MSTFPRRVALTAALATVGVLSAASSASATVEPPVAGRHTLVTWTQQGHTCTIVASSAVPVANLVDLAASRNS